MDTELSVAAVTPRKQAEQMELGPGCSWRQAFDSWENVVMPQVCSIPSVMRQPMLCGGTGSVRSILLHGGGASMAVSQSWGGHFAADQSWGLPFPWLQ